MDTRLPSWICFESTASPTTPPTPLTAPLPRVSPSRAAAVVAAATAADDDVSSSSPCRRRRRLSSFDRVMLPTASSRMKPPPSMPLSSPRRKRAMAKKDCDDDDAAVSVGDDDCQQEERTSIEKSAPSNSGTSIAANNKLVSISPCRPVLWDMLSQQAATAISTAAKASSPLSAAEAAQNQISPLELVSLCRQGVWSRALKRLFTHPHEAFPVLIIRPMMAMEEEEQHGSNKGKNNTSTGLLKPTAPCQEIIFQPTALGVVCSADWTNQRCRKDDSNQQEQQQAKAHEEHDNNNDENDTDVVLLALIQALVDICPKQVQCGQSIAGHTPLRDALKNPTLPPRALELLLLANSRLTTAVGVNNQQNDKFVPATATSLPPPPPSYPLVSALQQRDRDGLYPIDHAILGVVHEENSSSSSIHGILTAKLRNDHDDCMATNGSSRRSSSSSSSSNSVEMLATFLRHASPDCFKDPVDDGHVMVNDDDMANVTGMGRTSDSRTTRTSSPLVRLFSLGHSTSACGGNSSRQHQKSCAVSPKNPNNGQEDIAASAGAASRILQSARLLLQANPCLIYNKSPATHCSPIHVALRNYGNESELIRELMDADDVHITMRQRNHYGDLPLHVACSSGVPMDVLRLVLARTLAASFSAGPPPAGIPGTTLQSQQGFGGEYGPDPLIWSTNHAGYTPIDLEWIRHIEAGSGFFSHRAFYPLDPRGVQRPRGRYDDLYDSLLRQAVDQVLLKTPEAIRSLTPDTQGSLSIASVPISTTGVDSSVVHRVESDQVFGLLLHRIFLIVRAAFHDSFSRSPFDLSGDILHQASALCLPHDPTLPVPILELILSHYPEQVSQRDHLGKLPLHHAVQVHGHGGLPSDRRANAWLQWTMTLLRRAPDTACVRDGRKRLPLHCALDASSVITNARLLPAKDANSNNAIPQVDDLLKALIGQYPEAVDERDPVTGLFPFMLAASNPLVSLDMAYLLFRRSTTTFSTYASLNI